MSGEMSGGYPISNIHNLINNLQVNMINLPGYNCVWIQCLFYGLDQDKIGVNRWGTHNFCSVIIEIIHPLYRRTILNKADQILTNPIPDGDLNYW